MNISRNKYFLINVVVQVLFLGTTSAILTGGFGSLITIIIASLFSIHDPNILGILCVLVIIVPVLLIIGGGIGALLGILMSLMNTVVVTSITVGFSENNILEKHKLAYRFVILFNSTITNIVIWVIICIPLKNRR